MSVDIKLPYELKNAFFVSMSFGRAREVPQPIELGVATEIGLVDRDFPNLQLDIKVKTADDAPIHFNIHLVGIFEYQGEKKEHDPDLEMKFALERGVPSLWLLIGQLVKVTTAQMGVNPLTLRAPATFGPIDKMIHDWKERLKNAEHQE
jgi:hypothetical protein